ncbi:hypothetical protein HDU76_007414 [Blyttiomyces sp. JEL0837]|nr:hypothetical protein HDU76_007414 [Blyttiomyces sp. JEL0837]
MDPLLLIQDSLLTPLVGAECAATLLTLSPSVINSPCFSLLISKGLGIGIILGGSIVKVPQIIKIVRAGSAQGISVSSYLLETVAFIISLAYNVRRENPFSTYGETAFITIQNTIILLLLLHYSKNTLGLIISAVSLAGLFYALLNSIWVPDSALVTLQVASILTSTASKLPQIYANWAAGSTGQLSPVTLGLQSVGSAARVFTTLREVKDQVLLAGVVVAAVLNAALFAQVILFWGKGGKVAGEGAKKKKVAAAKKSPAKTKKSPKEN